MSAKKSHPEISPRPLIGVARRHLYWKQSFIGRMFVKVINFCRDSLAQNVDSTLNSYLWIVTLCSLLSTFVDLPRDFYFVNRKNFLNVYFVKWSWAWTLFLLGSFVFSSSLVYTGRYFKAMLKPLSRIVIATFFWFVCVNSFDFVERSTFLSGCSLGSYSNRADCEKSEGKWRSFEISGHVFILTYIALITAEELSIFDRWYRLGNFLKELNLNVSVDENQQVNNANDDNTPHPFSLLTPEEKIDVAYYYRQFSWLVGLFYVLNVLFSVLWLIMVTITSLYYHHLEQKLVAFGVGVACWFITYRIWYPRMLPGSPGYGKIRL